MELILATPTKLYINGLDGHLLNDVKKMLTYKDKAIEMQIKQMKHNFYLRQRYGDEWVEIKLKELNDQLYKSLLFIEDDGTVWTYSGLRHKLEKYLGVKAVEKFERPEFKLIPWEKPPKHQMRYYQSESVEKLINNPHSYVELPTGSGKSSSIMNLIKQSGLSVLVMAPSSSIVNQLYDEAIMLFGKKSVGKFAGTKKEFKKRIIIATGQSLTRLQKGTEIYEALSKKDAIIVDESHSVPAATFSAVCLELFSEIPYRWFVSATQTRNDGKSLLLEAIIGERVYEKSIKELQDQGYLAKLSTMIFDVQTENPSYTSNNVVKMNQKHFYKNEKIAKIAAKLAEVAVNSNQAVLILVDEHDQEQLLKKYMSVAYEYACGGSDVSDIQKRFNEGKIMCIVGTSAISTGTNLLPVRLTIGWQANRASTKVKQGAIGRSTRIHAESGKTSAKIVDFRVIDVPLMKRHANERIKLYQEVGDVQYISHIDT